MVKRQTTKSRSDSPVVVDKERARHVLRPLYETRIARQKLFAHIFDEEHAPQQRSFPDGIVVRKHYASSLALFLGDDGPNASE